MQMIEDLNLSSDSVELLKTIYRRVGKRDAGWQFDPSSVPAMLMPGLIDLYIEYLRESEGDKSEIEKAQALANEIASLLLEAAA